MIYFLRVVGRSIQIAACEDDRFVAERLAQGYKVVTQAEYIDAWKKREWLATMNALLEAQPKAQPPKERAVGSDPYPPDTSPGFTRLFKKKG